MNFISFNAAYSLYPIATFEDRCALGMPKASLGGSTENALDKYVKRGWRIYFVPSPLISISPDKPPFVLHKERWVGDEHTWTVPLDTSGLTGRPATSLSSEPFAWDPVVHNGWILTNRSENYRALYYSVQATVFRYNYLFPVEKLVGSVRQWANAQGYHSHRQLTRESWTWSVSLVYLRRPVLITVMHRFDAEIPRFIALAD